MNFKETSISLKFSGIISVFGINYIVKISLPTSSEIRRYLYNNKAYYIYFSMFFFIGIVVGIILSLTNESFYELLSSNKKMVFSIMNGTIDYLSLFWKLLFQFFVPMVILFALNLNFYLGKLSYIFVSYQALSMVVSFSAIIGSFGLFGIINILIILLPINILYFLVLFYFGAVLRNRSKIARRSRFVFDGFDNEFLLKMLFGLLVILVLSLFAGLVLPVFLKTFSFIIY
ncbi:MAG: hypothetical protein J6J33_02930 [Clostridia bacterium]|nr:hypothetical protein [Clostridia bacterium]